MDAASFVLSINIFVAAVFAASFAAISWQTRQTPGANWMAFAYVLGIANSALEFILPMQAQPGLVNLLIYAVSLCAFLVVVIGLARHYQVPVPRISLLMLGMGAMSAQLVFVDQSSTASFGRALVYQLPFFAAHLLGASVVWRSAKRDMLDQTLLGFLVVSGLQFVAKPFMIQNLGGPDFGSYLQSVYGAYSQVLLAFLLVANGVLMLLVIMRDAIGEMTARSETDKLSDLLNRRGFENRTTSLLTAAQRAGVPSVMVVADIDHFKSINDSFGHEAGDRVIASFAQVLKQASDGHSVVGRHGGEEFTVFIPGANLASGRLYAEGVRSGFAALDLPRLSPQHRISASFGVAQVEPGDSLSDLLRRADMALYEAKRTGRDKVCLAPSSQDASEDNELQSGAARSSSRKSRA